MYTLFSCRYIHCSILAVPLHTTLRYSIVGRNIPEIKSFNTETALFFFFFKVDFITTYQKQHESRQKCSFPQLPMNALQNSEHESYPAQSAEFTVFSFAQAMTWCTFLKTFISKTKWKSTWAMQISFWSVKEVKFFLCSRWQGETTRISNTSVTSSFLILKSPKL